MKPQNFKKTKDSQPDLLTGSKVSIEGDRDILVNIYRFFACANLTPVKADQFIF